MNSVGAHSFELNNSTAKANSIQMNYENVIEGERLHGRYVNHPFTEGEITIDRDGEDQ